MNCLRKNSYLQGETEMKKDGMYRFSLQFGSDSEDKVRVGEFLEKLGNRKSSVVVPILNEFLMEHPEYSSPTVKLELKAAAKFHQERLEQMISNMLEEKIANMQIVSPVPVVSKEETADIVNESVAIMLGNLDLFK